jgi:hypothetical protein
MENRIIPEGRFLGKLCSKGHDWNGTGQSLRSLKNHQRCVECERERRAKITPEARKRRNEKRTEKRKNDEEYRKEANRKRMEHYYERGGQKYSKAYRQRLEVRSKHLEYCRQKRREAGMLPLEERQAKYATRGLKRHLENLVVLTVLDLVEQEQQRYDHRITQDFANILYSRQKAKLRKAMVKGCSHNGHISGAQMVKRWKDFDNSCAYCGFQPKNPLELEVEHVHAISKGGPHTLSNIVPACTRCNRSKHRHNWIKWYRSQPFYDISKEAYIKKILKSTPYPDQQLELMREWQFTG